MATTLRKKTIIKSNKAKIGDISVNLDAVKSEDFTKHGIKEADIAEYNKSLKTVKDASNNDK